MAKTVIRLFDSVDEARPVVQALINGGFRRDDVSLVSRHEGEYVTERGDERSSGAGRSACGRRGVISGARRSRTSRAPIARAYTDRCKPAPRNDPLILVASTQACRGEILNPLPSSSHRCLV